MVCSAYEKNFNIFFPICTSSAYDGSSRPFLKTTETSDSRRRQYSKVWGALGNVYALGYNKLYRNTLNHFNNQLGIVLKL